MADFALFPEMKPSGLSPYGEQPGLEVTHPDKMIGTNKVLKVVKEGSQASTRQPAAFAVTDGEVFVIPHGLHRVPGFVAYAPTHFTDAIADITSRVPAQGSFTQIANDYHYYYDSTTETFWKFFCSVDTENLYIAFEWTTSGAAPVDLEPQTVHYFLFTSTVSQ